MSKTQRIRYEIDVTTEVAVLFDLSSYKSWRAMRDEAEAERKTLGGKIGTVLAEHGADDLTLNGAVVARRKVSTRRSVDYDRLAREFPEAYAACVTANESEQIEVPS